MSISPSTQPPGRAVIDLVRSLPLPAAVLHLDGLVGFVNDRLSACFGTTCLESTALREVISRSEPVWRALNLRTASGEDVEVAAQSIRHFPYLIVIIDDTSGGECVGDVEQLRHALDECHDPCAAEVDVAADRDVRSFFDVVADAELARAGSYKQPLSLLLIGIDRIHRLDDAGDRPATGDEQGEMLRTLRAGLRMADLLFRCGDDRFIVLAPVTDFRHARTLATGLRMMVEMHDFTGVGHLTISVGVTEVLDGESRDAFLARAERAMLESLESGGNRVIVDPRGRSDAWAASGEARPSRLVWQQIHECGHPLIDAQHRELFALTNELSEAVGAGGAGQPGATETLQRLVAHVARHFTDEEEFLEAIDYPFLGAHKLAHRDLLDRAGRALELAGVPGQDYRPAIDFLATEVIANHVFDCDRDYFALARLRFPGETTD